MRKDLFSKLTMPLLCLLFCCMSLPALDPKLELDEYAVERYSTENGLPQSSVLAMVQTRDGYLWLGTYEGLARFDGLTFTVFDKSNTPEMESNGIKALAESIRATVAQLAIPHPASPIAAVVTLSFGLASTIPAPGADANHFIARADQALYRTKRQGRNRISGS